MSGYPRPRRVPQIPLSTIAELLGCAGLSSDLDPSINGVTHAGAEARPGDLYVGLPGARHHGAKFAAQAAAAGAVAILTDPAGQRLAAPTGLPILVVEDPRAVMGQVADAVYGRPTERLQVIGITGTAGKTSTAYLIAAGLRAAGQSPGVIGTVETRIGDLVVPSARTTPEATDLHALFAVALENGVTTVVMEVSSHALSLGRVGGVRFAAGGFTNFGQDHLDFHPDLDDYFAAKAKLFDGRCAVEIVNIADPAGRRLVKPGTITYAPPGGPPTDWFATEVVQDGYRQRFVAHGPDGLEAVSGVGLPGRHNVANALLALALLTACGVDPKLAGSAIAECPGAPGRMERVSSGGAVVGIVDYAHKPDSITEVLGALERRPGKRIICVIGAGGDRDQGKRQLMGAAAARGSDIVIVTDDNPRGEDPAAIRAMVLEGARAVALESAGAVALESAGAVALETGAGAVAGDGGMSGATILEIAGRGLAITRAVELAEPGDVIALLGKGHETGQKIGDIVHPFDDRIELAQAMAVKERATVAKEADS